MSDDDLFGDEHVRRYVETDGEVGYIWREGSPILILTTTGRKSGTEYPTPLIFGEDGENYVIVGSQGGRPNHPDWYLNLVADPHVGVEVGAEQYDAIATPLEGEERDRAFAEQARAQPVFQEYQDKTERVIPVVALTRA
jgi:deazaflavin-dependent oxidoreductase (nitroreductase family)